MVGADSTELFVQELSNDWHSSVSLDGSLGEQVAVSVLDGRKSLKELVLPREVSHSKLAEKTEDPHLEVAGMSITDVVSMVGDVEVNVDFHSILPLQGNPVGDGLLLLKVLTCTITEDVEFPPKEECPWVERLVGAGPVLHSCGKLYSSDKVSPNGVYEVEVSLASVALLDEVIQ